MAIKGYKGQVKIGGTVDSTAKVWSLTLGSETVDTTTFASGGWKESVPTLKSWNGTITTIFDGDILGLPASLMTGDIVALSLELDSDTTGGTAETFTGNALITSMPITNDVNGIVEISFAFEGTGELTISGSA